MDEQDISFQYANECDLEIHCSPFGLSGVYIRVPGTTVMGIGSTMGLITGSTKGTIHYNDREDMENQRYKLFADIDDDGMLRIDFNKIVAMFSPEEDLGELEMNREEDTPSLVFIGKCPEGRPDNREPFIGIFSFEKEER